MRAIASLIVSLALTVTSCTSIRTTGADGRILGTVISPIDGDTITVRIAGRRQDVRLIGVDTPETKPPTKPVECGGPEASAFTASHFPAGTRVEIARDVEARDRYGRLLGYVYRAHDGLFLNHALVELGYARAYPFEPNTLFSAHFAELASLAQQTNRGMWGFCRR